MPTWSNKQPHTTDTNFLLVTGPINTANVRNVRIAQYLESNSGKAVARPGYQMSADGITWSATITALGTFLTTTGWAYGTTAVTVSTDQRLFVRFGLVTAHATSGGNSDVHKAMSRLQMEVEDTHGQTFARELMPVWSDGTTSPGIFHPTTGPISFEAFDEIRGTIEMRQNSGDAQEQPAWQVSNDGRSWDSGENSAAEDTFTTFEAAQTSDGTTYGTTFSSFSPTKTRSSGSASAAPASTGRPGSPRRATPRSASTLDCPRRHLADFSKPKS